MKTVVVMPNWVGDCVMVWPVLEALTASGRQLAVLAKPHLRSLLALAPGQPAFCARGETAATVELLKAAAFDEAVVLPNSFRSAWLPLQAEIPRRWGYRGDLRTLLLNPSVGRPRGRRPQVEDYRELLLALGVDEPATWTPRLDLPAALSAFGRERLERGHVPPGQGPIVGVFPGAEFGPQQTLALAVSFADLLRELRRSVGSFRAVIVAGPKELWTAVRVHEESGKLHPVIGPDLDLAQLAGVLSHFDLLVTNDSGPMHLAAAVGTPCVALFGPTDPRRTAPAGSGHRVLSRDLWCSPCFRRRCPLLHHGCLRGLGVTEVHDAALDLLQRNVSA